MLPSPVDFQQQWVPGANPPCLHQRHPLQLRFEAVKVRRLLLLQPCTSFVMGIRCLELPGVAQARVRPWDFAPSSHALLEWPKPLGFAYPSLRHPSADIACLCLGVLMGLVSLQ